VVNAFKKQNVKATVDITHLRVTTPRSARRRSCSAPVGGLNKERREGGAAGQHPKLPRDRGQRRHRRRPAPAAPRAGPRARRRAPSTAARRRTGRRPRLRHPSRPGLSNGCSPTRSSAYGIAKSRPRALRRASTWRSSARRRRRPTT
jgi:hypothetical protein